MTLTAFQGSLELGIIYAILALGVFLSFRSLNMPDLTVDSGFTLGAAVSVIMSVSGHPFWGLFLAFIAGGGAGCVTALLHTKLEIQPLLAGILTMLGLYSINLKVMNGKANIALLNKATVYSYMEKLIPGDYARLIFDVVLLLVVLSLLYLFLKTRTGFVLRATGDNDQMVRSQGVNTDLVIVIGMAISNGLVSLSGALIAQEQSFVDVGMGIGMVVIGLASVIIGEVVFGIKTLFRRLVAVILGSILYRLIIAVALELGMPPTDLKLVSAVIVTLALSMPVINKKFSGVRRKYKRLDPTKKSPS
ncbi:ABC transporter permease [Desulfitobacterium sp.]|uniref:ABC transporter permease n=1 Tax=Desulfitobacterium sp. TaxID=49981 RepID=UPI002BD381D5|nr:ABC transporter permease [Desulfitobacterium sp.]HVJ50130.1 ABC transporter permease [Desulfitobacterium sp.]